MQNSNVRQLRRPDGKSHVSARRLRANWPAELKVDGRRLSCSVLDVSCAGAKVALPAPPSEGEHVWLIIESIGPIAASVAWRRDSLMGLRFANEQQWVVNLGQQRFDASAWLQSSPLPP